MVTSSEEAAKRIRSEGAFALDAQANESGYKYNDNVNESSECRGLFVANKGPIRDINECRTQDGEPVFLCLRKEIDNALYHKINNGKNPERGFALRVDANSAFWDNLGDKTMMGKILPPSQEGYGYFMIYQGADLITDRSGRGSRGTSYLISAPANTVNSIGKFLEASPGEVFPFIKGLFKKEDFPKIAANLLPLLERTNNPFKVYSPAKLAGILE